MDRAKAKPTDLEGSTMTTRTLPLAAALLAAAALACSPKAPAPAAEAAAARGHALTGEPVCAGPGVHDVHVALFRCDTCHPTGATFGFDRPYTFPSGATTTAGGTFARDAAGVTCTVACHSPRGGAPQPIAWATPGPLACVACHAGEALPGSHPPVAANATRADCEACHDQGGHMQGDVVVRGHGPGWADPSNPLHAAEANADLASCRTCHGAALDASAGLACARCHDVGLPEGVASWKVNCVMCHGGVDLAIGAPPKATWGNAGDAVRVGAHTKHLVASAIAPAADCAACHAKPADVFSAGHVDGGTAEVVFGRAVPGKTQGWERSTATCSNTYCHAGVEGGSRPAPVWTRLGQGEAGCGACHGLPPPAPHPEASGDLAGCAGCHALTMTPAGAVIPPAEGGKHLNGAVEATGGHPAAFKDPASSDFHAYAANRDLGSCQGCHGPALDGVGGSTTKSCLGCHPAGFTSGCTGCHGAGEGAAPPRATWGGASDPLRVGAHGKHLSGGAIAGPIACGTCHVVPADVFAPGHLGDPFAEVTFSGRATGPGAAPAWSREAGTCSGVACHGSYSGVYTYYDYDGTPQYAPYAGPGPAVAWTGGPMTCTSCHGNPPSVGWWHSGRHGTRTAHNACSTCHPGVDATGTAFTDRSRHVDGVVDVRGLGTGCGTCH